MENKRFLTAQDVMEMLDVSLSYAYKLIRRLNAELEADGFVTIKGRVSTQYFIKRIYGLSTDNGYSYSVCGYMNVETKEQYSKEALQCEISAAMRVGNMETLDANIEAMERDLAEILRLSGEQERLWKAYEDWKGW